jgi:hypothetical protein
MNPPAPDSVEIPIETARMPGVTIAAMKPALSACTILGGERLARHQRFARRPRL